MERATQQKPRRAAKKVIAVMPFKNKHILWSAITLLTLTPALAAPSEPKILLCHVTKVTDGDTITIVTKEGQSRRIRLASIDAPELKQPYGRKSKDALSAMILGKEVLLVWHEKDRYRRLIGDLYHKDRWINRDMISEGWAWHYKKYSKDETLAKAEVTAREAKKGLWSDPNAIPPWEFREKRYVLSQIQTPNRHSP